MKSYWMKCIIEETLMEHNGLPCALAVILSSWIDCIHLELSQDKVPFHLDCIHQYILSQKQKCNQERGCISRWCTIIEGTYLVSLCMPVSTYSVKVSILIEVQSVVRINSFGDWNLLFGPSIWFGKTGKWLPYKKPNGSFLFLHFISQWPHHTDTWCSPKLKQIKPVIAMFNSSHSK